MLYEDLHPNIYRTPTSVAQTDLAESRMSRMQSYVMQDQNNIL